MAWGVGRSPFPLPTSMDAECFSLRECMACFIGELKTILSVLPQLSLMAPFEVLQDNTSVIDLAEGLGKTSKRRHIRMRVLYVIHLVAIKLFKLGWVPTDLMWADIWSKSAPASIFREHSRTMLGDLRVLRSKKSDAAGNLPVVKVTHAESAQVAVESKEENSVTASIADVLRSEELKAIQEIEDDQQLNLFRLKYLLT